MFVEFINANISEHLAIIKELLEQYAVSLSINCKVCYRIITGGFDGLGAEFTEPEGRLIIVFCNGEPCGCIGIKNLSEDIGEVTRLFVLPKFRNNGIGKGLLNRALDYARERQYKKLRLQTLTFMEKAIELYREYNFKKIEPYGSHIIDEAITMELDL